MLLSIYNDLSHILSLQAAEFLWIIAVVAVIAVIAERLILIIDLNGRSHVNYRCEFFPSLLLWISTSCVWLEQTRCKMSNAVQTERDNLFYVVEL